MNPFETLGIEPAFELDVDALERRYRELARVVHPDRFSGAGAAERRRALGKAVDVNAAFRTLRDPLRRAEALLALHGASTSERDEPKASPALLMEVMELREELAEVRAKRDATRLTTLAGTIRAREARALGELGSAFSALAAARDGGRDEAVRSVKTRLGELRYLRRFLDEAEAVEEDLSALPAGRSGDA